MNVESADGLYCGWLEAIDESGSTSHCSFSVCRVPDQPHLVDCKSLHLDAGLHKILEPLRNETYFIEKICGNKEPWELSRDLQSFVNEISLQQLQQQQLIPSNHWGTPVATGVSTAFAAILLDHMEDIGWEHIESISPDMSSVLLSCTDDKSRKHYVDVVFEKNKSSKGPAHSSSYPSCAPKITTELPVPVSLANWPREKGGDLRFIVNAVVSEANRYSSLLDILGFLDDNCCILEPRRPTFAITSRRIALERLCSIYIDFPKPIAAPRQICTIRFLGPPDKLKKYQSSLRENSGLWDITDATAGSVKNNLELVLSTKLPLPSSRNSEFTNPHQTKRLRRERENEFRGNSTDEADTELYITECGICYAFSNTDYGATETAEGMPDFVCSNEKCSKMFHKRCIVEWLHAVPSSKSSFGTLFGNCPYCNEWLGVKIS